MGSTPLQMIDVKVYYSHKKWVQHFASDGCQSLLQSTRMGLTPLLMIDIKVY